ncbi:MAG: toast rack family protein [Candidatus Acidiferrales bacterium]
MSNGRGCRRGSLFVPLVLIAIGALWLYANFRPDVNAWDIIARYWPVLIILLGFGKLVDYFVQRNSTGDPGRPRHAGEIAAVAILVILFFAALSRPSKGSRTVHETKSVDAQGASSVAVSLDMPAGNLSIEGGATKLLEGDFSYSQMYGEPNVDYSANGANGSLSITQDNASHVHFGTSHNRWDLHLNDDETTDLKVNMGAGEGNFHLSGLNLSHLDIQVGAGEVNADLGGNWKKNVDVNIQGGVGTASVRLPRDVGVQVHASGGIGTISTDGLRHDGDDYVNNAFGKSPVTMRVEVTGGVGSVHLIIEP